MQNISNLRPSSTRIGSCCMDTFLVEFFAGADDLFVSLAAELPVSDSVALVLGRFPFPLPHSLGILSVLVAQLVERPPG